MSRTYPCDSWWLTIVMLLDRVSGLETGQLRPMPQSSSLSATFPGSQASIQSQAQILANYQRAQQQQQQARHSAMGGSGDAWSSQRSATFAHPGLLLLIGIEPPGGKFCSRVCFASTCIAEAMIVTASLGSNHLLLSTRWTIAKSRVSN